MDGYCGVIYKATNTITGKCYVGQSVNFNKRKRAHFNNAFNKNDRHYNCHFHRAIRKYGKKVWEWNIILECPEEDLDIQEIITIEAVDSFHNGYNETAGGGGNKGYKRSEKTKLKTLPKEPYFIQLNLQTIKHKDLIEWIKERAELNDQSLSTFCINSLKERYDKENTGGSGK